MSEWKFIGRTPAYYEEEDDSVFTPDYWTYSDEWEDECFDQCNKDIYKLTDEGMHYLDWWLECRMMNEYQRNHCFNFNKASKYKVWEYLTNPENNTSIPFNTWIREQFDLND